MIGYIKEITLKMRHLTDIDEYLNEQDDLTINLGGEDEEEKDTTVEDTPSEEEPKTDAELNLDNDTEAEIPSADETTESSDPYVSSIRKIHEQTKELLVMYSSHQPLEKWEEDHIMSAVSGIEAVYNYAKYGQK